MNMKAKTTTALLAHPCRPRVFPVLALLSFLDVVGILHSRQKTSTLLNGSECILFRLELHSVAYQEYNAKGISPFQMEFMGLAGVVATISTSRMGDIIDVRKATLELRTYNTVIAHFWVARHVNNFTAIQKGRFKDEQDGVKNEFEQVMAEHEEDKTNPW